MTEAKDNFAGAQCLHAISSHLKVLSDKITILENTVLSDDFISRISDETVSDLQVIDHINQSLIDTSILLSNLATESGSWLTMNDFPQSLRRGLRLEATKNLIPNLDTQDVSQGMTVKHGFIDLF